jgi:hypothetical protein
MPSYEREHVDHWDNSALDDRIYYVGDRQSADSQEAEDADSSSTRDVGISADRDADGKQSQA